MGDPFVFLFTPPPHGGIKMFKDPIVEEVRAVRQKHAACFNYDLVKIAEDLKKKQKSSKHNTVSYPTQLQKSHLPKKIIPCPPSRTFIKYPPVASRHKTIIWPVPFFTDG